MAPEISTGNYNKQIDVYGAGIILYEMLTGRVPFDGESSGEILMKHLTAPPDLSRLPSEYVPVVAKALAKNPAHRYASMAEMARAVEGIGLEAPRVPAGAQARAVPVGQPARAAKAPEPVLTALPAVSLREKLTELFGSMALTVLFAALATILWAALGQKSDVAALGNVFFLTVGATWAILIPAKFWTDRRGDGWTRRIIMMLLGGGLGLMALWLDGWTPALTSDPAAVTTASGALVPLFPSDVVTEASYFSYYALAFFALRWWRMTARRRSHRFSFAPILAAGFWGLVLLLLVRPQHWPGALVLVLASAIVQLVSPWEQPPPPAAKRMRLRYA
jgi:hypothetical protein